jgi:hypothetical protein
MLGKKLAERSRVVLTHLGAAFEGADDSGLDAPPNRTVAHRYWSVLGQTTM